jgi:hypothetical protein
VVAASQHFATELAACFSSIVLARVFLVVPFAKLPAHDKAFAVDLVSGDPRLDNHTRVLSLAGTHGRRAEWCARLGSTGHLAIPLLDQAFVDEAPMLARLVSDLELDLVGTDEPSGVSTRRMAGGLNRTFYVEDARVAVDARGRHVIPNRPFVEQHGVRTVFGMGGAYLDGVVVLAVVFTDERVERLIVDRFPSLVGSFKIATAQLAGAGRLYDAPAT